MSYKITEEGNVATVHLDGEIDMDVTEKAKEVIMPLIEAGKEVHLNLKEVQYMDSSGISVLIESHQKAAELGTKVILKEIRNFAREVLAKDEMFSSTKDDVVLAIAEAAQNIVKHAYSGQPTGDTMRVEITFKDNTLKIDLFDKGKPVIPQNIKPRKIDDVKPGGLGTFFIGQIMDEVVFKTSASDWVNHLILTKNY